MFGQTQAPAATFSFMQQSTASVAPAASFPFGQATSQPAAFGAFPLSPEPAAVNPNRLGGFFLDAQQQPQGFSIGIYLLIFIHIYVYIRVCMCLNIAIYVHIYM
jgi:hypothetical protein